MNKQEYFNAAVSCDINNERVDSISKLYGIELPEELKHVVSYADTVGFFDEERRALSYAEIIEPLKKIGFDFIEKGLIPIIDAYDNTYIVFSFESKRWMKYNLSDDIEFDESDKFMEVL